MRALYIHTAPVSIFDLSKFQPKLPDVMVGHIPISIDVSRLDRKFSSADPSKPEISGVLGSNPAGMLCSRTVEINYVY